MIEDFSGTFLNGFNNFIAVYYSIYILIYLFLAILSVVAIKKYVNAKHFLPERVLTATKHTKGVSVIAPAYNEGKTIIYNVKSLLSLNYPKFELIIINDGSEDDTMEKLIAEFDLVKVSFYYQEAIKTRPVRGHYKSTNPIYSNLIVVDKENGKSKADASNAGINTSQYPLFICTDVDCILQKDTITKLIKPFVENKRKVIATGATIRISNGSVVKEGYLLDMHYPKRWYPRFQELEYVRTFLFGRMAWSQINSLLLVSGGLGMFDKEIVVAVGGYWDQSLGEDMELITRMRKYMHQQKQDFLIKYIPESLCWTEVPDTRKIFMRQRTRWGRGLIQTLSRHKEILLNPKYGRTGLFVFPYYFLYEFLAPIIEVIGLLVIVIQFCFTDNITNTFIFWVTASAYLFYINITMLAILIDELLYKSYASTKEILTLVGLVLVEPIVYHPVNIYAVLKGYVHFFIRKEKKWGKMNRRGYQTENAL
ncbi:glycosyltransferase [Galbibacter sp. EGI 63066]|uniref:glycosyltransferase family 2 protein n=1 Tax=Galbibacter sp. EGI 63066 TaxID=2993559 RepID=UPI0022491782|nr:glycosyltransferase [Galbibacter sp. EGI 63066]MCX2678411.1 glycosyltransferase [Galbibacter sp. EGI 63066]